MEQIDRVLIQRMREMGFEERNRGTAMIRYAAKQYRPGMFLTKELYPMIAVEFGSTPGRVERNMRHACTVAAENGGPMLQVGEMVARLKVDCDL